MVPQHIAIIPDGNRRWAQERGLPGTAGHSAAIKQSRILAFIRRAKELGIAYISLWAFSTENWKRKRDEVDALMELMRKAAKELKEDADEHGIRFRWLGRRDRVPADLKEKLEELEQKTKEHKIVNFQLCLDYGGRDELLRAVNAAIARGKPVTEETFSALLDTNSIPDPDLIIRTSGEQRLSGFFAFQGAYAELYFTDKHFPAFTPDDLSSACAEFDRRQRRFGGN